MKIVLLVEGGRPAPPALTAGCAAAGIRLQTIDPAAAEWRSLLTEAYGVMLMLPAWGGNAYLNSWSLWQRYLMAENGELRLLTTGYEAVAHPNHIDLLRIDDYGGDWWERTLPLHSAGDLPSFEGIQLNEKLRRFFDGHGDESVMAVLSRIRLVVQMASRELHKMHTPYTEIYAELVAPAQLADKWREWRNRWINYYPLFAHTPLAGRLEQIALLTADIEPWMLGGGTTENALENGTILQVLNDMRDQLQYIEKQYVVQKLSPAYR